MGIGGHTLGESQGLTFIPWGNTGDHSDCLHPPLNGRVQRSLAPSYEIRQCSWLLSEIFSVGGHNIAGLCDPETARVLEHAHWSWVDTNPEVWPCR